jgi:tetratricopeptide (TPR) repeat protein
VAVTPLQQAYFLFLQARLLECQEEYDRASALYKQVQTVAPRWHETIYRQGVCMVKIGFTDQALSLFHDLISLDPHYFNKILIDIELERGRVHILTGMWKIWNKSKEQVEERSSKLDKIAKDLTQWFRPDDQFRIDGKARLDTLMRLQSIDNFVSFEKFLDGLQGLSQDMSRRIEAEIKTVNEKMERSYRELREVYREAAWFPFPRLLKDFNRDFNASAEKLRFVRLYPLHAADNFKKSMGYLEDVEIQIKKLRNRLVTLRIIRDGTYFILLLGRNFMWLELAGLGLSLLLLPVMSYCSQKFGGVWWADTMIRQKWQIQKGLVIILSIVAMAVAALKTAIVFEKKKSTLFNDGK